jgi:hypothetical protein
MFDLLRDPIWQVIGTVLGLIAIILVYFASKTRKVLSYEVISRTQLLSKEQAQRSKFDLKIEYRGSIVNNADILLLKIQNKGNRAIVRSDFDRDRPIFVYFGRKAYIMSVEVVEKHPGNIDVEAEEDVENLHEDSNEVVIQPFTLNRGEYFIMKIFLAHFNNQVIVDARLIDVQQRLTAKNPAPVNVVFRGKDTPIISIKGP